MESVPDHYLRIAKCGRAVGLKGEVAFWPISNIEERYQPGNFFIDSLNVEYVIEKIRKNKDHYVAKFEHINDRDQAERIVNVELFAEPLEDAVLDEGEYFIHQLVGKNIVDQDGVPRGTATGVVANAASDLLENDQGDLIPFRFIESVDDETITVDVPEGLFDDGVM